MKRAAWGGFLLGVVAPAFAQAQDDAGSPGVVTLPGLEERPADPPQQLGEIMVTAQKSAQRVEEVPLSVTAIDGAALDRAGANDLADVSLYLPNVRIDGDDVGATSIFIRGFGSNAFNSSIESAVGFVVDEVYYGRPGYVTDALFDIERIEVLRGPQGTLFGKNTVAGLVTVTSAAPGDELGIKLDYKRGAPGEQRVEGGLDLPLGDWGGARLSGLYRNEDGELYNQFLGRGEETLEQGGGRLKLRMLPRGSLSGELTLFTSQTRTPAMPWQLYRLDDDTRQYLQGFDPAVEDDPLDFRASFDQPGFVDKQTTSATLRADWDLGVLGAAEDAHATLVLGGSRYHVLRPHELDGSPADVLRLENRALYRQQSAELRLSGTFGEGPFGWGESAEFLAGAFLFDSSVVLRTRLTLGDDLDSFLTTCDFRQLASRDLDACGAPAPPPPGAGSFGVAGDTYDFDFTPTTRSGAAFGQLIWRLSRHWGLVTALRLSHEEKRADISGTNTCATRQVDGSCPAEAALGFEDYALRGLRRTETDLSPRLALQYFTGGGPDLYLSYSLGHKSGGYNFATNNGQNVEFKPEEARTAELGAKGRGLNRTLRYSIALFDTEFDNLQTYQLVGTDSILSNAASAYSRGMETELTWLTPLPALSVSASLGVLRARYRNYKGAAAPVPQGIGATQDLSGQRLAYAPPKTAALAPRLDFFVAGLSLHVSADAIYQGEQYTDVDLDPATYVPSYWKFAARVRLGRPDERWAITLGGNNLTGERVLNQVMDAVLFPASYYAVQAPGRSLYGSVTVRW